MIQWYRQLSGHSSIRSILITSSATGFASAFAQLRRIRAGSLSDPVAESSRNELNSLYAMSSVGNSMNPWPWPVRLTAEYAVADSVARVHLLDSVSAMRVAFLDASSIHSFAVCFKAGMLHTLAGAPLSVFVFFHHCLE